MTQDYASTAPDRSDIDSYKGPAVIEFGTSWCGHCQAAQPAIASAFTHHPGVRHIKVEDGSGRALGRSFEVKLWPTLIFMRDGKEQERLVRPREAEPIARALAAIDPA